MNKRRIAPNTHERKKGIIAIFDAVMVTYEVRKDGQHYIVEEIGVGGIWRWVQTFATEKEAIYYAETA